MNQPESPSESPHSREPTLPRRLSPEESRELAERLTALSSAGLPLSTGLRAAADESRSQGLANVLRAMAQQLEAGLSLEDVLTAHGGRLPDYLQGAILAGIRTGRLPQLLVELVDADRRNYDVRREVTTALAYPALLLLMMVGLFLMVTLLIMPQMIPLYADFETELPASTGLMISLSTAVESIVNSSLIRTLFFIIICTVAVYWLASLVWRRIGGRITSRLSDKHKRRIQKWERRSVQLASWPSHLAATVPLLGVISMWQNVAWWARLLAAMVERDVPLPQALAIAAQGVANAGVAGSTAQLSPAVANGRPLAECVRRSQWLPASLVPIIRWGEATGQLPEALRTAADMFEARASNRASLIKTAAPPLMFLIVATGGLLVVTGLFSPLLFMIRNLA